MGRSRRISVLFFFLGRYSQGMTREQGWFRYLKQGLSQTVQEDRVRSRAALGDVRSRLKNLRPFVVRHWRKGVLGSGLILLTSLLGLPQPLITRYLIDNVILGRRLSHLVAAILLLGGFSLAVRLVSMFQEFYFARLEQNVLLDIQHDLFEHSLRLPKSFFDEFETGYLMSRLSTDVQGLQWFFSGTAVYILANAFRLVGGLAFLFYLEWRLAVAVLVVLPGAILLLRYFCRKNYLLSHKSMEQQAAVSSQFEESLSSISLIKAFSSEHRTVGRLQEKLRSAARITLEQAAVNSAASFVVDTLPGVARALALAVGAFWVIRSEWTLGSLLAFQGYLLYVFGPAQYLATAGLQLQHALAALERVSSLFDLVPEENVGRGMAAAHLSGDVEFRNVTFAYSGRERVLEGVSFRIHPGEHVAIVGPSGVGKTTLVSLILRFYKPVGGEIYFDGRPAVEYEVGSLRQRIGYVAQSTILLNDTIRQNLLYGNPEASDEQLIQAVRAADLQEFIASLPEGYNTRVGESGARLSEGQKQRLSIARALVKDPNILVLDEPTSALDSQSERSILETLPTLVRHKTLFIVAHCLSTIQDSDRILLLNENRLVAVGTHGSLMESSEYYRSLVALQQMQEKPTIAD